MLCRERRKIGLQAVHCVPLCKVETLAVSKLHTVSVHLVNATFKCAAIHSLQSWSLLGYLLQELHLL